MKQTIPPHNVADERDLCARPIGELQFPLISVQSKPMRSPQNKWEPQIPKLIENENKSEAPEQYGKVKNRQQLKSMIEGLRQ